MGFLKMYFRAHMYELVSFFVRPYNKSELSIFKALFSRHHFQVLKDNANVTIRENIHLCKIPRTETEFSKNLFDRI